MKKVLIVDDEQPARERLRRLLSDFDTLEIVGEAEDGEQAMERIAVDEPDLVFLDIEMPGCSGLDVAASLGPGGPRVVFCTAYDQYAVDAFDLHAVDYLLKPVHRARLARTLERALRRSPEESSLPPATKLHAKRFLGKKGTRFFVVPVDEVLYFASEGGLTLLKTGEHRFWLQPTLQETEARLDEEAFYRVSRSTVVALAAIREVQPVPGGQGELRLTDGSVVDVSRRRFKGLIERLGG